MERAEFERLVEEVVDALPREFAARLENVAIMVEDEPEAALMRSLGLDPRRDTLFGLYQGVPLTERGASFGNALPDTITVFQGPLERACRTPDRLRREVRRTLIHEIGHHFGFEERALRREGY